MQWNSFEILRVGFEDSEEESKQNSTANSLLCGDVEALSVFSIDVGYLCLNKHNFAVVSKIVYLIQSRRGLASSNRVSVLSVSIGTRKQWLWQPYLACLCRVSS